MWFTVVFHLSIILTRLQILTHTEEHVLTHLGHADRLVALVYDVRIAFAAGIIDYCVVAHSSFELLTSF